MLKMWDQTRKPFRGWCHCMFSWHSTYANQIRRRIISSMKCYEVKDKHQTKNQIFESKRPLKRIKHVGQTLSNIVGWCWMVFDHCWIVLDARVFKRIHHHPTILDFGTRTHDFVTRAKMLDDVGWKVWTKTNFIQSRPTPSSMFDRAVQTVQHVAFNGP